MEIIQERLEREFDLDLITTAPSCRLSRRQDTTELNCTIDNPTNLPDPADIEYMEEPMVSAQIILAPSEYVGHHHGAVPAEARRVHQDMKYLEAGRVQIHYEMPLNEIIYDFFDALKSAHPGLCLL